MIEIQSTQARCIETMQRLADSVKSAPSLMRQITGIMMDAVEQNFEEQGRPKWLGLKPGTIEARRKQGTWPGKILQRSGQLAASITPESGATFARVGTNKKYAAIQQLGGDIPPHIIKARNKKALAFGGKVRKSVKHPGATIRPRPFLLLTDSDAVEIEHIAENYLRHIAGQ